MPGVCGEILDGRRRQPAAPEERVDLAVLERSADSDAPRPCRVTSRSGSRPAARSTRNAITSVPLPGEPVDTVLPRRSATDAMPLAGRRDDVRVVGVEDREARGRHGTAVERAAARDRVGERVGERERDVRLAVANQLEVVDRGRRDFRRRPDARQVLVEDLGEPAAVRVVDAAGAAGRDREEPRARLAAVRAARGNEQSDATSVRAKGSRTLVILCGSRLGLKARRASAQSLDDRTRMLFRALSA